MKVQRLSWASATDWDRFIPEPVNTSTGVQALGVADGEGTVDGGSTGDGQDRIVYVLNDFQAIDVEAQLNFRLLHDTPGSPAQVGIVIFRTGLPIVVWTNIVFAADGRLLLGAWNYNGTALVATNQDPFIHDCDGNLFGDPDRLRAIRVKVEGDQLFINHWYLDEAPPDWVYAGDYPDAAGARGAHGVGLLLAHTSNNRSSIRVDSLRAVNLNKDVEWHSTEGFIQDNPYEVILNRHRTVETPAGGTKKVPLGPLPPQLSRLVESGLQGASATRHLPDGRVVNVQATLVLHVGADIQRGDTFSHAGEIWECGEVGGRWATRVEVWRYAG